MGNYNDELRSFRQTESNNLCSDLVDSLTELKTKDVRAYRKRIQEIQLLANSEEADYTNMLTPRMADSVLLALREYGDMNTNCSHDEFMGDETMFTSYEEAIKKGEMPQDFL